MLGFLTRRVQGAHPGADALLREDDGVHLVFKHSPLCLVSAFARDQVERFGRRFPALPITVVDVIRQRVLSDDIAARTRIPHESPQVLLVGNGRVHWHASHGEVTMAALVQAVARLSATLADERGAS